MRKHPRAAKTNPVGWFLIILAVLSSPIILLVATRNKWSMGREQIGAFPSIASFTPPVVTPSSLPSHPPSSPPLDISIDKVATFADRYFIKGSLKQSSAANESIESIDVSKMFLTDSTGKQIAVEPLDFGLEPLRMGLEFSLYTHEKGAPGDLTLTIPSANFALPVSGLVFDVDFGTRPEVNQEWKINKDFVIAERRVRISTVATRFIDNEPKLEFTVNGVDIVGARITDISMQTGSHGDFQSFSQDGKVIVLLRYADALPSGKHRFTLESITSVIQGEWQMRFDPTSIDTQPSTANSDFYNACIPNEIWRSRETISAEIPARLSGMLLVDNAFTGSDSLFTATIDLRGNEKQNVLPWPLPITFSPDGTMIIYYDWQIHGARLVNLHDNDVKEYPWDKAPSNRISWLEDTDLIAYDSDDGIYISHIDGSGLQKVNGTDGETLLGGWLPDGEHVLVSRKSYKKPMLLQLLNVSTGETKDLFSFSSRYITAAIPSPNGQKVLFEDNIAGAQQTGIFIANLDGTDRHLIASFWRMLIGSYTWSPDGRWVIVSVTDVKHGHEMTSFLIKPDSCETIRLSNIDWAVRAWGGKP